jgi:Na+-transporting methylmalonyl-CoA/oxaloacetate decarboxylase gamma subunit
MNTFWLIFEYTIYGIGFLLIFLGFLVIVFYGIQFFVDVVWSDMKEFFEEHFGGDRW